MSEGQIISCQLHDYIEIACLYGYSIELQLTDRGRLQGRAKTTQTSTDRKEWLVLDQAGEEIKVELAQIRRLSALTRNPHFDVVDF